MTSDLVRRVGEILHGYNTLYPGIELGVAVSGGADSVVMFHILNALAPAAGWKLSILHVNHQLRGAESDADETFVRNLAASSKVPFLCTTSPVSRGNIEQEARRGRYLFFQSCKQMHRIEKIALGHNRSDQVETILFRLFRGSGLAGLAGILPVTRQGLIRPLLSTSRNEIRAFARAANLSWREDTSNEDLRFRRNRLRLVTIPQLRHDYNPSLERVMAGIGDLAQGEEDYWRIRIASLYRRLVHSTPLGFTISVKKLRTLHVAQQRRLLRECLRAFRGSLRSIDLSHIDGVLEICGSAHGHDRLMIPGVDAIRSFDTLLLTGPDTMKQSRGYELKVPLSMWVELPFHAGRLIVRPGDEEDRNCVTVKNTTGLSAEDACLHRNTVRMLNPGESLEVRNWEPGDKLQRVGSCSAEKIKTLFQENRIVLWERRHWPVLVVGGEIAWVRGFGTDARFCPGHNVADVLHIRFEQAI